VSRAAASSSRRFYTLFAFLNVVGAVMFERLGGVVQKSSSSVVSGVPLTLGFFKRGFRVTDSSRLGELLSALEPCLGKPGTILGESAFKSALGGQSSCACLGEILLEPLRVRDCFGQLRPPREVIRDLGGNSPPRVRHVRHVEAHVTSIVAVARTPPVVDSPVRRKGSSRDRVRVTMRLPTGLNTKPGQS
jgi:hypothetical protein